VVFCKLLRACWCLYTRSAVYSRCAALRAEGDSRRRSVGRGRETRRRGRETRVLLFADGRDTSRSFAKRLKNGEKKDDVWTCRRPRCADQRCEEGCERR